MSKFYTSVTQAGDKLFVRGYIDGKPIKQEIDYRPYLFVHSGEEDDDEGFRTIKGKSVTRIRFDSITDARNFQRESEDVGRYLYGLNKWPYVYINDMFQGEVQYDPALVSIVGVDIETDSDHGFGLPETADKQIWTITLRKGKDVVSFGYNDYTPHRENITYIKCENEEHLLEEFLKTWQSWAPDIVTGWYIEFYDMPYLINRIRLVLGAKAVVRLSPFRRIEKRRFNRVINGASHQHESEVPVGVSICDYMSLYKKFSFVMQESYKLDHIAFVVLGKRKLDYNALGYDTLSQFYHGNFQKFLEYNIIDIDLIFEMDEKLRLMNQVMAIAYDAKVNFIDSITTVTLWDVMAHNFLMNERKQVVPFFESQQKDRANIGGYVKTPAPGMHKWLVSVDATSLYPHIDMQYNISPDTLRGMLDEFTVAGDSIELMLNGAVDSVRDYLIENNLTVCPTGCLFDRSVQGFFPALMERIFKDRDIWKKRMLEAKKAYEATKTIELEKEIARCWSMQQAKKIEMNSGYGALANAYFRWFDIRLAESVTSSGQLSIRWAERHINTYLNKMVGSEDVDFILAADTDSLYINFEPLVQKFFVGKSDEQTVEWIDKCVQEVIEPKLEKIFKELAKYMNAYQQKMKMKREAIANKGIWTAKKHYILNVWDLEGVRYKKPEIKLTGIEAVRSSTPMSCRTAIKDALYIVLNGTEADLQKYVAEFRARFSSLPFEEVAFPRSVKFIGESNGKKIQYELIDGKGIQKGTPIAVKGALLYNALIKNKKLENKYALITADDKIKFSYMLPSCPIPSNVLAAPGKLPKEFDFQQYIDYDTQFQKAFLDPLSSIVQVIKWQVEKSLTLESLFG